MSATTTQGYIAARFYGMRSRLLTKDDYLRLLTSYDLSSFIADLRNFPIYKTILENRLLLEDPLTAVDSTINIVLSERMKKVIHLSGGVYQKAFKLLSFKWELANIQLAIRSILRTADFQPYFIPIGDLNQSELLHLAKCSDLNEALNYLESILNPLAQVVRQLIEANVLPTDLDTVDGIFNQFYYNQIKKGIKNIKNRKIANIMKKTLNEEREFENTKTIINFIGRISRGTALDKLDFSLLIFPGKARILPEEIELAVRKRDIKTLQTILLRTSYRDVIQKMIQEAGMVGTLQIFVEEIEKIFLASQTRKRFKRHAFNLGLGYIWQMTVEARNLRILTHGLENFTQNEIEKRLFLE
ncbi:V-type ATPase subunit [Candidatus Hodarchaeum mangrovi]